MALLAIIGILLLSQIVNVAAGSASGVPIHAARIGAALATATGYRFGVAANNARLALRNPFDPTSTSHREELSARQHAGVGLRAASWALSAEFLRLRVDPQPQRRRGLPPGRNGMSEAAMSEAAGAAAKRVDPNYYAEGASWEEDVARRNRNSRARLDRRNRNGARRPRRDRRSRTACAAENQRALYGCRRQDDWLR